MPISRTDEWVQIASLNEHDQIVFTPQFRALMGKLGWEAKAFVGHLLGLWYDPSEHMLDYSSGEAQVTIDQPGVFDRNGLDEPQDVVEYWLLPGASTQRDTNPPIWRAAALSLTPIGTGMCCALS